jgi:hypothetical protein
LEVLTPGGNYVPEGAILDDGEDGDAAYSHGSISQSWDNNYEHVDFVAPVTGVYTIRIKRHRVDPAEIQNWVGMAAWIKP